MRVYLYNGQSRPVQVGSAEAGHRPTCIGAHLWHLRNLRVEERRSHARSRRVHWPGRRRRLQEDATQACNVGHRCDFFNVAKQKSIVVAVPDTFQCQESQTTRTQSHGREFAGDRSFHECLNLLCTPWCFRAHHVCTRSGADYRRFRNPRSWWLLKPWERDAMRALENGHLQRELDAAKTAHGGPVQAMPFRLPPA